MAPSLSSFEQFLRQMLPMQVWRQHQWDLRVYRAAHQVFANRCLHWLLIPCEVASLVLALVVVSKLIDSKAKNFKWLNPISVPLIDDAGYALGLLSLCLAVVGHRETDDVAAGQWWRWLIGLPVCLFHVGLTSGCDCLVDRFGLKNAALLAIATWVLAWLLQVGVGHHLIEGNQPNVANMGQEVSTLAIFTSVVIAWKS